MSVWFVAFGAFETFASFEILLACLRTALLGPHMCVSMKILKELDK
jgi:hypothetical protein